MSIHFHGPHEAFSDKTELWLQSEALLSKEIAYISNFKWTQVFKVKVLIIFGFECSDDRCVGGHSSKLWKIDSSPFVDE